MSTRCVTPFVNSDGLELPCGKCANCRARRVSGWSWRLSQHDRYQRMAYFVTLTYDPEFLPRSPRNFRTLVKADLQKFFKRLRRYRKHYRQHKISYYACGEYGSEGSRPHYHIILFNADPDDVEKAWSLKCKSLGHCHFDEVNEVTIGYVLKYMTKPPTVPRHRNDDRVPEFSLMSKGIGKEYITSKSIAWHHAVLNERFYVPLKDGKRIALPRYMKDKMYDKEQRKQVGEYMSTLPDERETYEYAMENFLLRTPEQKRMLQHDRARLRSARLVEKL